MNDKPDTFNKKKHYTKIFLSVFAPLFLFISATVMLAFYYQKEKAQSNIINDEMRDQQTMKNLIQRDISMVLTDLLNESHLRELESVVNDGSVKNIKELSEELLSFSRIKGIYDSVRYIDEKGREKAKILMEKNGPYIVPENELQDKGRRYYFTETMKLEKNQIYMSRFDLKMEHGMVEFPFKPDIRLASPLFSKDGKRRGIFILNYMGGTLFKEDIEKVCDETLCQTFLVDSEGYFLKGARPEDEWGFMFKDKKEITFSTFFRKEWKIISGKSSGHLFTEKGFFLFDTVLPGSYKIAGSNVVSAVAGKDNKWILVSYVPKHNLFPGRNRLLSRLTLLYALLLLSSLAVARSIALNRTKQREAEEALRLSEQRLSTHVMNTPLGVIEWDRHFRVEEWNRSAEKIFGFSRNEALGRHAFEIIIPITDHDKAKELWDGIFQKKKTGRIRFTNITKTGREITCEWFNTLLTNEAGEVTGIATLVQNITKRVKAEESLKSAMFEIQTILDTAQVGIFFLKDNRLVWVNHQMYSIFGYGRDEIIGASVDIFHLFPEDSKLLLNGASKTVGEGNTFRADHILKRKDGSLFWCHILARAIDKDHPESGSIWITEDISEAKQREDDLQKAKEEAEEAVRTRDKFVSLVSHDLKGPLTVIRGYSEILRECESNFEVLVPEISNATIECCDGMNRLINDILSLSRVKEGRIKPIFGSIDARSLVESVVKKYDLLAQKKGVAIRNDVEKDLKIYADERLLEEVLANLVSNAVKFTKNGDEISIYSPKDGTGIIAVKDTGIGISEKRIEKLFRYEEKTSTYGTSGESGSGFGLPLAKDMMIAMGGDITLESEVEKGTTFYITLPRQRECHPAGTSATI